MVIELLPLLVEDVFPLDHHTNVKSSPAFSFKHKRCTTYPHCSGSKGWVQCQLNVFDVSYVTTILGLDEQVPVVPFTIDCRRCIVNYEGHWAETRKLFIGFSTFLIFFRIAPLYGFSHIVVFLRCCLFYRLSAHGTSCLRTLFEKSVDTLFTEVMTAALEFLWEIEELHANTTRMVFSRLTPFHLSYKRVSCSDQLLLVQVGWLFCYHWLW